MRALDLDACIFSAMYTVVQCAPDERWSVTGRPELCERWKTTVGRLKPAAMTRDEGLSVPSVINDETLNNDPLVAGRKVEVSTRMTKFPQYLLDQPGSKNLIGRRQGSRLSGDEFPVVFFPDPHMEIPGMECLVLPIQGHIHVSDSSHDDYIAVRAHRRCFASCVVDFYDAGSERLEVSSFRDRFAARLVIEELIGKQGIKRVPVAGDKRGIALLLKLLDPVFRWTGNGRTDRYGNGKKQ